MKIMNRDFKRRIAYEILIFLGLLALLVFITKLWPILFLIILGIFICALRLLFLSTTKIKVIMPAETPKLLPRPDTEQDILQRAYGVIVRHITEEVTGHYPTARWVWSSPNAIARIARDEPVSILLSGAGGFRRAEVRIHNLQFIGLDFQSLNTETPDDTSATEATDNNDPEVSPEASEKANYRYLAFEWMEAHLYFLNERCNEAIEEGKKALVIPTDELPETASWPGICQELLRNGFSEAVVLSDGIQVSLPQ